MYNYIWSRVPCSYPPPRDGLLGTMRQKAFNKNDLERDKEQSSSGYSSSCMITCCYASAANPADPPNGMGPQVAPPSLLSASYWQHF